MDAFVQWVRATSASNWINSQIWLWPAAESVHFIGLSLLIGCVGFFDLRLMGFFRRVPLHAARHLMPFAMFGFVLNLVSGAIFLIGLPQQYANSWVWWMKVLFLLLAGVNAIVFETVVAKQLVELGPHEPTPPAAKVIGGLSLVSWLAVLYWGRMLPFIGDAF